MDRHVAIHQFPQQCAVTGARRHQLHDHQLVVLHDRPVRHLRRDGTQGKQGVPQVGRSAGGRGRRLRTVHGLPVAVLLTVTTTTTTIGEHPSGRTRLLTVKRRRPPKGKRHVSEQLIIIWDAGSIKYPSSGSLTFSPIKYLRRSHDFSH